MYWSNHPDNCKTAHFKNLIMMIWYKQNDEITLCPSSTLRGVIVGKCHVTFVLQLLRLYQIICFGWIYFIFISNCPTYILSIIWGFKIDNSKIKRTHRPLQSYFQTGPISSPENCHHLRPEWGSQCWKWRCWWTWFGGKELYLYDDIVHLMIFNVKWFGNNLKW